MYYVPQKVDSWKKKETYSFNQMQNFLINNRVIWNLLATSNPGTCWPSLY